MNGSSQQPESTRNGPLSIDEMLELTRSSRGSGEPPSPSPPPAPTFAAAPPPPPPVLPLEPISLPTFHPITLDGMQAVPPLTPAQLLSTRKTTPGLKKAGLGALGVLVALVLVMGIRTLFFGSVTVLINSKPEGAKVFLGEELMGKTPVELELSPGDEPPVLKMWGYKAQPAPPFEESGELNKVYVVLEKLPFPLDWKGLPNGTRVWWKGAESLPRTGVLGAHEFKVKPAGQSSFQWTVDLPWQSGEAFVIGEALAREIKERPVLKLALSGTSKAEVIVKDGARFTQVVSMAGGPESITLPGPGKYRVKVKATHSHGAFEQEVVVKEGARKSLNVALWEPHNESVHAPAYSGGWSSPADSSPRPAPAPVYQSGGGGGGRIAPPAF